VQRLEGFLFRGGVVLGTAESLGRLLLQAALAERLIIRQGKRTCTRANAQMVLARQTQMCWRQVRQAVLPIATLRDSIFTQNQHLKHGMPMMGQQSYTCAGFILLPSGRRPALQCCLEGLPT